MHYVPHITRFQHKETHSSKISMGEDGEFWGTHLREKKVDGGCKCYCPINQRDSSRAHHTYGNCLW